MARKNKIIGVEIFWPLAFDTLDLRLPKARLDSGDHAHRQLVLEREDVVKRAVVTIRPDMTAGFRFDELSGNTHSVRHSADASLEHVAHAKLAPGLLHVDGFALIGKARIAGDDKQPLDA